MKFKMGQAIDWLPLLPSAPSRLRVSFSSGADNSGCRGTDSPYQVFRSGFSAFLIQVAGKKGAGNIDCQPRAVYRLATGPVGGPADCVSADKRLQGVGEILQARAQNRFAEQSGEVIGVADFFHCFAEPFLPSKSQAQAGGGHESRPRMDAESRSVELEFPID